MKSKAYARIGLAMKAGKLVSGEDTCMKAIKKGKGKLVIIASDSTSNTCKRFNNMCKHRNIPCIEWGTKEELGKSIGKHYRAVVCVIDESFAQVIMEKLSGGEA